VVGRRSSGEVAVELWHPDAGELTGIALNARWASIIELRDGLMAHAAGYLTRDEAVAAAGLE
jgi:hypothetical protein